MHDVLIATIVSTKQNPQKCHAFKTHTAQAAETFWHIPAQVEVGLSAR